MSIFAALADPTRRGIVESLARGALSSGEIAERFDISASAISQHLKVLREAQMVRVRAEAQRRIYELDPQGVNELAGWVVAANDGQGYPFAIMDKAAAQILVFGGDGRLRGAAPGLFGSQVGDHTAPGIAGLALREIPGRDRTTPSGRFVGGYGPSIDAGRVLWVDYDSAVSIHPTATGVPAERRPERLASPTPDDNRVTHGCINVAPDFYEQIIRPTFERGGVFYILPDEGSLAEAFPEFAQGRE